MAHADFVHLRVRTAYSLLEGAIRLDELVETCRDWRMPAVAIADRGNMFGALEFSEACRNAGVQPIVGCDLAIGTGAEQPGQHGRAATSLLLLAQDEAGYGNLMALTSEAFIDSGDGGQPLVTLDALAARSGGLLALSGGPAGPVGRLLLDGQVKAARALLGQLGEIFPGRLYVELMRHGLAEEEQIEAHLIAFADELELPLVATNDAYFLREETFEAHDALLCIAQNSHVEDENRRRLTPQHRFRPADEMRALFADLPEAVDNTLAVARRCAVMAPTREPILPVFTVAEEASEADALRARAAEGLERRLEAQVWRDDMDDAAREAAARPYRERLAYELGVIVDMQFAGYFLIVADIVRWARGEGIPVGPGRGSGAGSVVAWSLTITDLDPLRFGLLFERFLNPERVSMPDFDIDFCPERRDEVIDYVCRRYGKDRVAQIITFGKLQARAVLRDVGRVLGLGYGRVDRLCKLVPYNPANPVTLQQALDAEPRLKAERDGDPAVARLIEISLQLEGLYRHASTHAAGIVIGDRPLSELVPLYRDPRSEMPATQFSMKYVEMAGLVKFDLLGLKTLTVLDHTVAILRDSGVEIDLNAIPLDDEATYEMLGRGVAMGVFQLESAGMRDALRSLKPDCIEDIIALVALYRPGPMDNIPRYIACKHGKEKPDYLHPRLTGLLEETFGVIIYQEQVMEIAKVLAGYSLGSADLLRRAMGKKIKAEMDAQRETFVDGALANEVSRSDASRIFELVAKFAGYGFNKSHAAAYALVAYQTAYLKANHPVEFLAASMSLEINSTDRLELFRRELERLGIALLPPDVNASQATFSVEQSGGRRQGDPLCARRHQERGRAGDDGAGGRARAERALSRSLRPRRPRRSAPDQPPPDREPGEGRRLRQPDDEPPPGGGKRRRASRLLGPGQALAFAGLAFRRRRRDARAAAQPAGAGRLGAERAAGVRARGGGLLPLRPSARFLRGRAQGPLRHALGPGAPAAGGWRDPLSPRRRGAVRARARTRCAALCLHPALGSQRQLRGGGLPRDLRRRARRAGAGPARPGDGPGPHRGRGGQALGPDRLRGPGCPAREEHGRACGAPSRCRRAGAPRRHARGPAGGQRAHRGVRRDRR